MQGNYIGTDRTGTVDLGNTDDGIRVFGNDNILGGSLPGQGNLISGNGMAGIQIAAGDRNVIRGNLIGTNARGTGALGNGFTGVWVDGDSDNVIGGHTTAGEGNVISGNGAGGIRITASFGTGPAAGNLIEGNRIGTDPSGTVSIGNTGAGILIESFTGESAAGNTVGGTAPLAGNVIAVQRRGRSCGDG